MRTVSSRHRVENWQSNASDQSSMAKFKDRDGHEWEVNLDALVLEEIEENHQVDLVNLEKDPVSRLRNDPKTLVAIIHTICRDQIDELGLEPRQFAKRLPAPPDPMLEAVENAIVDFFPSGRASHVREVLTKYEEMATKTDELARAKIRKLLDDPATFRKVDQKADQEIRAAMKEIFGSD